MHTGSYGLMSGGDSTAQAAGPGGQLGAAATWPVWSGPVPPLAEGFTVRPDTAPGLEAALTPGATVALVPEQVRATALDWRASSGKTQLARHFAESLWRSPGVDVLTWVVATSRASVLDGLMQAATAIGADGSGDAEAVAARYADWLSKTSRPWLLVLDDLRDAADLAGLWPSGPAGRVLITTAHPAAVPEQWRALTLPVPAFSTREAMGHLSGRLSTDPDQRSGAIDLVGDLGCEPAALAHAGAVIATSGMSCRDYRQHFTHRQKQLVEAGRAEPSAAAVTWTFSAEYAEHLSPEVSIRSLLALAAQLDGHGIPGVVFTTQAAGRYLGEDGAARAGRQAADPQRIWNAVLSLRQAGLLAVDPPGPPPAVRISPVLQAVIRAAVPDDVYDRAALAAADRAGLAGPAIGYWRELTATSERILGPGSLDTLTITSHLAEALMTAGQAAEAITWFQRVLDGRCGVLGPDHPDAITAKVCLGRALVAVGRSADAIRSYRHSLADRERLLGARHPDTMAAGLGLADAHLAAGQVKDAIAQYKRVLAEREDTLGPDHPATLACQAELARGYYAAGRLGDASALLRSIIARAERALPPGDPMTANMRETLARITGRLSRDHAGRPPSPPRGRRQREPVHRLARDPGPRPRRAADHPVPRPVRLARLGVPVPVRAAARRVSRGR